MARQERAKCCGLDQADQFNRHKYPYYPTLKTFHIIKYTVASPFDLNLPSPSVCVPTSGVVSAMAEAHPTSVIATEVQFGHGSRRDPCQCDIDVLRQEINDLRTTLEVVVKDIEGLKRVKIEAVSAALLSCARNSRLRLLLPFDSPGVHRRSSVRRLFFLDHRLHLLSYDGT